MFPMRLFIVLLGLNFVAFSLSQIENNPWLKNCPLMCPPGWKTWRGSCYRTTPSLPWIEAGKYCQDMGGEMAAPRSLEENEFFDQWVDYSCDLAYQAMCKRLP